MGFAVVMTMKKKLPMTCNVLSAFLVITFVINTIVDYTQYSAAFTSAPFSLCVLVNALFLVIPAIVVFIIGSIVKKDQ